MGRNYEDPRGAAGVNKDKRIEWVWELIEALKKEPDALILVEGQHDMETLQYLGITHEIMTVGGKRMFDDLSPFEGKNVIILTDFDLAGQVLFKRLRMELEIMGYHPNSYYWNQLKKSTKGFIKAIEELDTYLHSMKGDNIT